MGFIEIDVFFLTRCVKQQLEKVNNDENLAIAFGAVAAAGSRQRGKAMFEFLECRLSYIDYHWSLSDSDLLS